MRAFIAGLLLGAGLLALSAFFLLSGEAGCLGRCGDGTRCDNHRCVAAAPAKAVAPAPDPGRRKRRRGGGGAGAGPAAPSEPQLRPGDEKMTAQGDALGRPERIDLTQEDGKELDQADIDRVFQARQGDLLRCIDVAVGDAPFDTGKVEVGLRIERSGAVSRVRVEAPALLMRSGLYGCVRGVVTAMRFPASGGAAVITYPFELR